MLEGSFFLLLQEHGFAKIQSVSDRGRSTVPSTKGLELDILLGPQNNVAILILGITLQGPQLLDIVTDHLQRIQEWNRLVLPGSSCVFQDKFGDADRAELLVL